MVLDYIIIVKINWCVYFLEILLKQIIGVFMRTTQKNNDIIRWCLDDHDTLTVWTWLKVLTFFLLHADGIGFQCIKVKKDLKNYYVDFHVHVLKISKKCLILLSFIILWGAMKFYFWNMGFYYRLRNVPVRLYIFGI